MHTVRIATTETGDEEWTFERLESSPFAMQVKYAVDGRTYSINADSTGLEVMEEGIGRRFPLFRRAQMEVTAEPDENDVTQVLADIRNLINNWNYGTDSLDGAATRFEQAVNS